MEKLYKVHCFWELLAEENYSKSGNVENYVEINLTKDIFLPFPPFPKLNIQTGHEDFVVEDVYVNIKDMELTGMYEINVDGGNITLPKRDIPQWLAIRKQSGWKINVLAGDIEI
ncbi:MAG: hypothetical protein LJE74_04485 [Proteobacteria bacterium]|nr:hypothetical protein [Pseudomonadota bacterium]MCG6935666.1 hypothetical protein [Pseudomonadota bacterium]